MAHDTYASRLRYLDADDLDDSVVDFNDLDVYGSDGERLGELDGFLVEPTGGRVLYAVVDSGGWFTSRRFLLPVEQATVDHSVRALRVNVSRQSLRGYPEFHEDRFGSLSDDEFHAYHRRLGASWTSDTMTGGAAAAAAAGSTYHHPAWWPSSAYRADRLRPIESRSFAARTAGATAGAAGLASDERHTHGTVTHSHPGGERPHTHDRERELVTAHDRGESRRDHDDRHEHGASDRDDVSPHYGGRAQPGDVLGLETGGETTGLGDTAEDENKRRRDVDPTRR